MENKKLIEDQLDDCNGIDTTAGYIGLTPEMEQWADSAYFDEKDAHDRCNEMNSSVKNDPNYLAYVVGPIPLN